MNKTLDKYYDALAYKRDSFLQKNAYYHFLLNKRYKYFIPQKKKILEVGCGTGALLNDLNPSIGHGVDLSPEMIKVAETNYSHLHFHAGDIDQVNIDDKFDYIVLPGLLGELDDIQDFLEKLRAFCTKDTRIIIEYYSYLWQYILKIGEKFGMKLPQDIQNWVTQGDIDNFLTLAGYEMIRQERCTLFPIKIWGLSYIINKLIAPLPIVNALTLNHFIIARPIFNDQKDYSSTILVPCRNEKGNIEAAITRTPSFGSHQEFIFVEGGSSDGTYEEIERIIQKYPEKDIKVFKQNGKGKGDAVRLGFDKATADILMILDADLTVPPEELPKFYEAIRQGKGEFINGCRLVYPMDRNAMRLLNLIANKFFGLFFSWLLGQKFRDTLCGTKVMFKYQYEELVANRSYFGDFDPFGDFDLIFLGPLN